MFEIKMDWALNNLQRFICHNYQPTEQTNIIIEDICILYQLSILKAKIIFLPYASLGIKKSFGKRASLSWVYNNSFLVNVRYLMFLHLGITFSSFVIIFTNLILHSIYRHIYAMGNTFFVSTRSRKGTK